MKTVSLRELHHQTGYWVRESARWGEIQVTDDGRVIAKIVPHTATAEVPYFARRKTSAAFRKLDLSRKLAGGTDSTQIISEDRDSRP